MTKLNLLQRVFETIRAKPKMDWRDEHGLQFAPGSIAARIHAKVRAQERTDEAKNI